MEGVSRAEAESEAIFQALEVINFGRRGNSTLAKIITAVTPFLNARIQGLDVLYRAGRGRYSSDVSKLAKNRALVSFISRGSLITFSTIAYSLMAHDDEEWKNAGAVAQDDNWIMGGLKIPIPFEVGVIFKLFPERFIRWYNGEADNRKTAQSIKRAFVSTFEFNAFGAQITKPLMEAMMNYSWFTGQPIVPLYLEKGRTPGKQSRPSTDQLSVGIGEAFNISPLKVSHMLKGYGGTLGSYVLFATDWAIRNVSGMTPRPTLREDQMIGIKRFYTSDLSTRTVMSDYYDLQSVSQQILGNFRSMLRDGDAEGAKKIMEDHGGLIATKNALSSVTRQMDNIRRMRTQVYLNKGMSPSKRAEVLDQLDRQRNALMPMIEKLREVSDLPMPPFVEL